MPFKSNYRFDRAERTRNKAAKKMEKLEAQAARRKASRDMPTSTAEAHGTASSEPSKDHDGSERENEKKE